MNPLKAVKAAITGVTSFARFAKAEKQAFDVWRLAEEAQADPSLYSDAHWKAKFLKEASELIESLPLPTGVQTMLKAALTNWKTTLAGLGIGFGAAFFDALAHGITLKSAAIAAAGAMFGALAKDADVTGGTKPATPEATTRTK